jgi:ribosomal-protein-serine acetyltransferase
VLTLHVREGLDIRLLEIRHAPVVFARVASERDRLREWLPWVDATESEAEVASFIGKSLARFTANNGFDAGIWLDGQYSGGIGVHYYDWVNRRTEVGYWLSQAAEGRGIMTACCRAVVRYAFEDLLLHRVEIRCATGNLKSRRIPERLGFTLEGTLRKAQFLNGRYVDIAVYGLLRGDQIPSSSSAA